MMGVAKLAFEAVEDVDHVDESCRLERKTGIGLAISAARTGSR